MRTKDIGLKLEEVVKLIVAKDLSTVFENDLEKGYAISDLLDAIEDYPDTLQLSPNFHNYLDFRFYFDSDSIFQVEFEIWANGEPSDLTLILSIIDMDDKLSYSLRDLRVM